MNYLDLINIRYKTNKLLLLLFVITISILVYILYIPTYDFLNVVGYVKDNKIEFKEIINYPDMLDNIDYIKINNKVIKDFKYEVSNIMLDKEKMINYRIITLDINDDILDNLVLNITIYYNKERMIDKITKGGNYGT